MTPKSEPNEPVSRRPKPRIYQEDAKTRQTSHWDWDYLPLKTLERRARERPLTPRDARSRKGRRRVAVACIAAGALLLVSLLAYIVFAGQPMA